MPTFNVHEISTRKLVYQFDAASLTILDLFPESDYEYSVATGNNDGKRGSIYGGRRILTKLEYRRLFTFEERMAIDSFTANFLEIAFLSDEQKAAIRTSLKDYEDAQDINLDDADTVRGIGLYVQFGLILPNRLPEVLNG